MTQGGMRVEEYERHFKKMMWYTPDDTNTDQRSSSGSCEAFTTAFTMD
jgi:hypothetical protein